MSVPEMQQWANGQNCRGGRPVANETRWMVRGAKEKVVGENDGCREGGQGRPQ